ncbi:DUF3515 domain-containing protein [Nocardia sp. alder85J]|uniref:DUF3515 domain-containing protein n=1 Tax=Nocardia sp. alder85J TaxID=2862949 RepID=UPI001CD3E9B9|nr:DUF3515 domain-containing protein [Nocardia sp. alder85J]MCX4094016.1 DUF3515 domain-containing protein [Nocardia sp. alder85J]
MSSDTEQPTNAIGPTSDADAALGDSTTADSRSGNAAPDGTTTAQAETGDATTNAGLLSATDAEPRKTATTNAGLPSATDAGPREITAAKRDGATEASSSSTTVSETPSGAAPGSSADPASGDSTPVPAPQRSPALIATAVALPVALIVGVLVVAVLARQHPAREPLALGSVSAPAATGPACTTLLPALPGALGGYDRAELAQPAPPATVAWQPADGGDAIVLRCGLDRPQEFDKAAALQIVDGVTWFELRDRTANASSGTYFAVDRGTYIALTLPDHAGPTPLQEVSDTIAKVLPAQQIDPGPLPN